MLFPLRFRDGGAGFIVHLPDQGVTLADGSISWTVDGGVQVRALSDLRQVRLAVAPGDGRNPWRQIGHCELSFRDGRMLTVFGGGSLGQHDAAQAVTYRRFVHDLHAQIAEEDRRRIVFFAGRARGKGPLSPVALGFIGAVVVIAGSVLAAKAGVVGVLAVVGLVGVILLAFLPQMMTNSGGDYHPAMIPDALTPN